MRHERDMYKAMLYAKVRDMGKMADEIKRLRDELKKRG